MLKYEVLAIVMRKLPNVIDAEGNVAEVEQVIKNHCHIKEVPAELKYTWGNMAVDLARYELALANKPEDTKVEAGGQVTGIKSGHTSFELSASDEKTLWMSDRQSHKSNLDAITLSYTKQLNLFRCMGGR